MRQIALVRDANGCVQQMDVENSKSFRSAAQNAIRSTPDRVTKVSIAVSEGDGDAVKLHTFDVGPQGGLARRSPRITHALSLQDAARKLAGPRARCVLEEGDAEAAREAALDPDRDREPLRNPRHRWALTHNPVPPRPREIGQIIAHSIPMSNMRALRMMLERRATALQMEVASLRSQLATCQQQSEPAILLARSRQSLEVKAAEERSKAEEARLRTLLSKAESALVETQRRAAGDEAKMRAQMLELRQAATIEAKKREDEAVLEAKRRFEDATAEAKRRSEEQLERQRLIDQLRNSEIAQKTAAQVALMDAKKQAEDALKTERQKLIEQQKEADEERKLDVSELKRCESERDSCASHAKNLQANVKDCLQVAEEARTAMQKELNDRIASGGKVTQALDDAVARNLELKSIVQEAIDDKKLKEAIDKTKLKNYEEFRARLIERINATAKKGGEDHSPRSGGTTLSRPRFHVILNRTAGRGYTNGR